MSENLNLEGRIADFVRHADEVTAAYWKAQNFTHSAAPTHRADYISEQWARVVTIEVLNGVPTVMSVYGFIRLTDGHTRTLGTLRTGDIHKAASFKAPAKHARGNVFQPDFGNSATRFGIVYKR